MLNLDGPVYPSADRPGEEYVPPLFAAVKLPRYLTTISSILFGTDPDSYMRTYRVAQFMAILHGSSVEPFLLALDSRITYDTQRLQLMDTGPYLPVVTQLAGASDDSLHVSGRPDAPDVSGRTSFIYNVELLSTVVADVIMLAPRRQRNSYDLTVVDGLSNPITLVESGYKFKLGTDNPGQRWRVEVKNRPQRDLSALVANLSRIGEPTLDQLFGVTKDEPFFTFRNLWFQKEELPLKLGGLLCALIYRLEAIRLSA